MNVLNIFIIQEGFPRKPVYCCRASHPEHQQEVLYKHANLQSLKELINLETHMENHFKDPQ